MNPSPAGRRCSSRRPAGTAARRPARSYTSSPPSLSVPMTALREGSARSTQMAGSSAASSPCGTGSVSTVAETSRSPRRAATGSRRGARSRGSEPGEQRHRYRRHRQHSGCGAAGLGIPPTGPAYRGSTWRESDPSSSAMERPARWTPVQEPARSFARRDVVLDGGRVVHRAEVDRLRRVHALEQPLERHLQPLAGAGVRHAGTAMISSGTCRGEACVRMAAFSSRLQLVGELRTRAPAARTAASSSRRRAAPPRGRRSRRRPGSTRRRRRCPPSPCGRRRG